MKPFFGKRSPAVMAWKIGVWLVLGAVIVWLVMLLWNWLMPALFSGVRVIDYWQTLGLIVLCRVLFGGHHGRWHGRHRWEAMSADERAQLKRGRWGQASSTQDGQPR
jgi:hypothetical protein